MKSVIWFLDGTFKCAPAIFFQLFANVGAVSQPDTRGVIQTIGLPFVYALLENKEEASYQRVLDVSMQKITRASNSTKFAQLYLD